MIQMLGPEGTSARQASAFACQRTQCRGEVATGVSLMAARDARDY